MPDEHLREKFLKVLPPSKTMQLIKIMELNNLEADDFKVIAKWEELN